MQKPELVAEIVKGVSAAVTVPVTVNLRKGWDERSINAVEIAKVAEQSGAKAVTVHGRTREQFYSGQADWEIIKQVKQAINIPVIGNGDITSPEAAKRMLETTGCDAIMIGRGAEGNPWIFKRILAYIRSGSLLNEPSNEEKILMAIYHLKQTVRMKGEAIGVKEMRKHLAWYLKGMPGSSIMKTEIFKMNKVEDAVKLLHAYLNQII